MFKHLKDERSYVICPIHVSVLGNIETLDAVITSHVY